MFSWKTPVEFRQSKRIAVCVTSGTRFRVGAVIGGKLERIFAKILHLDKNTTKIGHGDSKHTWLTFSFLFKEDAEKGDELVTCVYLRDLGRAGPSNKYSTPGLVLCVRVSPDANVFYFCALKRNWANKDDGWFGLGIDERKIQSTKRFLDHLPTLCPIFSLYVCIPLLPRVANSE